MGVSKDAKQASSERERKVSLDKTEPLVCDSDRLNGADSCSSTANCGGKEIEIPIDVPASSGGSHTGDEVIKIPTSSFFTKSPKKAVGTPTSPIVPIVVTRTSSVPAVVRRVSTPSQPCLPLGTLMDARRRKTIAGMPLGSMPLFPYQA